MLKLVILIFAISIAPASARDLGQWSQTDPDVATWYRSLMAPDQKFTSCCGEADAYYADKQITKGDKNYAVITDDRPDKPLGRPHVDTGTVIEIPREKMMVKRENPTGHDIIFLSSTRFVMCFILSSGI